MQRVTFLQVLEQCKRYCDEEAIICLQEVSRDWKCELDQLFRARGWSSSAHLYAMPFPHCIIVTLWPGMAPLKTVRRAFLYPASIATPDPDLRSHGGVRGVAAVVDCPTIKRNEFQILDGGD